MITCNISTAKPYCVHVAPGLLGRAGSFLRELFPSRQTVVVTDSHVAPLYLESLKESLRDSGIQAESFVIPAGEASKNWEQLGKLLNFLAERQLSRSDYLIALGGGVVGDLTGFAASVYQRGIPYVQLPTTLLAAVDSSVGGKTAVDLEAGKNQAGTFWQPSLVLCDTDTLRSLSPQTWRDGAAESLKYGVLGSFDLFQDIASGGLTERPETLIAACINMKGDLVAQDEKDSGARQYLNLGHTFGHAIEARSHFSISHGQGVAMGMVIAAQIAARYFPEKQDCTPEITSALEKLGLPTRCPYSAEELIPWLTSDKKRRGNVITLVLPRNIGHCQLCPVTLNEAEARLREVL